VRKTRDVVSELVEGYVDAIDRLGAINENVRSEELAR
jgi:hypothetical protein